MGRPGGIQRVAGKRGSGSWDTQKWLISKDEAHQVRGRLVGDTANARHVLEELGSEPMHVAGDRFKASPRRTAAQSEKPARTTKQTRRSTTRKAQASRRKR